MSMDLTLEQAVANYAQLRDLYPILEFKAWSKQDEVQRVDKEVRGLAWANRCGKSSIGAKECVEAGMGWQPWVDYPKPPFTIWAVSTTYRQMEDSIIPAFEGDATHHRMLPKGVKLNRGRMEYELPSGSKIRLKSSEAGREAFQGAAVPLIWLDEDHPASVLKEIFMRIGVGFKRRILWTITAVNGLNYLYTNIYKPWLDEQNSGRDHPQFYCSVASMDENPHLDKAEIDELEKYYPPHSKEYQVRRYGGFANMAGDAFFPETSILAHGRACRPGKQVLLDWVRDGQPIGQEHYGSERIVARDATEEDRASVTVYHEPYPGDTYVIGADIAEGRLSDQADPDSDRDHNAAIVWNRDRGRIDAILHTRQDPHTFMLWCWLLGHYYNYAWLCPEVNNNGAAVIGVLRGTIMLTYAKDLPRYVKVYARETRFDEYVGDVNPDLLGFRTTVQSRPKLVEDLYDVVVHGPCTIEDAVVIEEMKTFQKDKKGKAQAASGYHDDTIMAFGLAIQAHVSCPSDQHGMVDAEGNWRSKSAFDMSVISGGSEGDLEYAEEEVVVE